MESDRLTEIIKKPGKATKWEVVMVTCVGLASVVLVVAALIAAYTYAYKTLGLVPSVILTVGVIIGVVCMLGTYFKNDETCRPLAKTRWNLGWTGGSYDQSWVVGDPNLKKCNSDIYLRDEDGEIFAIIYACPTGRGLSDEELEKRHTVARALVQTPQLIQCLEELVMLTDDMSYEPDSYTTQPARILLNEIEG